MEDALTICMYINALHADFVLKLKIMQKNVLSADVKY